MGMEGKIALVTGSSSGLGKAIAMRLAEAGAEAVVVADLRPEPREGGTTTVEGIAARGGCEARFVSCDVSDPAGVERAFAEAAEIGPLDVLVNNAGIVGPSDRLADIDDEAIDRVLAVNVKGVLYCCRAAARRMVPRKAGSIVNVSSVVAHAGSARSSVYAASKGAVAATTYALAAELGPAGVRVNAIHPGMVETAMTTEDQSLANSEVAENLLRRVPLRSLGAPRDVAAAVAFVAGDEAAYMTGASIVVDGGWSRAL
jgi:NAD(P)-dependent dehydrogenase (short-subunit alcohol dehydrogenase family)